jgi:dihydrofolate reductase
MTLPLIIVAALADNHVIGEGNRLIWRLKSDLRRFREITMGRPLVMGRKTFESIGKPLPGRHTVVLTRDRAWTHDGVAVAHRLDDALAIGRELAERHDADSVVIGGGADIYAQTLPMADRLRLTYVHARPEGDAFFPSFDRDDWREICSEHRPAGPDDEYPFTFVDLNRRR